MTAQSPVESVKGTEPQWYAVHVIYGKDKVVCNKFCKMGLIAILPLATPGNGHGGKNGGKPESFLPGYVLVYISQQQAEDLQKQRPRGVASILGVVNEGEMAHIQQQMDGVTPIPPPANAFAPGTTIQVTKGVFTGFTGVVGELQKKERLPPDLHLGPWA